MLEKSVNSDTHICSKVFMMSMIRRQDEKKMYEVQPLMLFFQLVKEQIYTVPCGRTACYKDNRFSHVIC